MFAVAMLVTIFPVGALVMCIFPAAMIKVGFVYLYQILPATILVRDYSFCLPHIKYQVEYIDQFSKE